MDRFAAMIVLLGVSLSVLLMLLALFSIAPVTSFCLIGLLYSMYLFMAYEESGVHQAQEFENRFWTVFALFLSTALFFAKDSPLAFGLWNPSLGFVTVLLSGYVMHLWDRYLHRVAISQQTNLRRNASTSSSLTRLHDLGIPVEDQLTKINACLRDIDQLLIPSTINNFINQRFILSKEREIINVFEECDARALNYLINHVQLGLLFYKIKDHRNFNGKHRTELISLLAVERLTILTVISRVIVLHSLQLLKLRANPKAEVWVRNILLNTHRDELSELKTLTDAKGDYFCMNKLIFDDIRSETVRQDILNHIRKEAAVQQTHLQMGTRRAVQQPMQWRKVLSDVDDTLYSSGGTYPAGVDKRYPKKTVYPGVLAFYRELDLGTQGPEEWQDESVGNLVFLSARPHLYKDVSERANFAKFQKLRVQGADGRKGMHTVPSLLAGDLASGSQYLVSNDLEPLARKKFDNFRRYASIYPEYQHVFVCDNGQGDVRAGEMMFDGFPYEFEALYVQVVKDVTTTHGYNPTRWREKEFAPCFFRTYPEAALHAAQRKPPMIRMEGLQRICHDTVKDFAQIKTWSLEVTKAERRLEINQAIWKANDFLEWNGLEPVELIQAERRWLDGEGVRTPYGIATIRSFDPVHDMYEVSLDWRPLDVQIAAAEAAGKAAVQPRAADTVGSDRTLPLATVEESEEVDDDVPALAEEKAESVIAKKDKEEKDNSKEEKDNAKEPDGDTRQNVGESSAERPEAQTPPSAAVEGTVSMPVGLSPRRTVQHSGSLNATTDGDDSPEENASVTAVEDLKSTDGNIVQKRRPVLARINGRSISKYTPPVLPTFEKRRAPLFSFLGPAATTKQPAFKVGDQCITPYGPAQVVEIREKQSIVVVEMVGWTATAYLQADTLNPIPKSLLAAFLRQFSTTDEIKPLEFPHASGTVIDTPFGKGSVARPIPAPTKKGRSPPKHAPTTLGLDLESWTLADGSHPTLYCTVETARAWRERKVDDGTSILSALGTLVTSSRNLLQHPFLPTKATPNKPRAYSRYYQDAASVTTQFGDGVVMCFREADGFYEIALTKWTMANGKHPRAFLQKENISYRIAAGCEEGYPVLTALGLSGTLASVEPTTGVHIVTIQSAGMVCYLQPDDVLQPLKAAVGEDVLTAYGEGKVAQYNRTEDKYVIALNGWNAKLYAKGDTFDRVGDGIQDRDSAFGVNWLLRFLFYSNEKATPRSRSNSVTSAISGTHSNK